MAGLYAKIDCEFPDDPKVIDAGPMAELVYLRCLLRSRATLSDGVIDRRRLARWCVGIKGKPETHAAKLVEVGLWDLHPDGWCIPGHKWSKWNPTAAEVDAKREEEAERKRQYRASKRPASSERHEDVPDVSQWDATERAPQSLPTPLPLPKPSSRVPSSQDAFKSALEAVVTMKTKAGNPRNHRAYAAEVRARLTDDDRKRLAQLVDDSPSASPHTIAEQFTAGIGLWRPVEQEW